MSNLYGYSDYNGPKNAVDGLASSDETAKDGRPDFDDDLDDSDLAANPLQVGFWMDGDSLAPPCGSSIFTIQKILNLARVNADDILYDLGCGDGRVCLEAYAQCQCREAIGVEIEPDLVQRAEYLISQLAPCPSDEPERGKLRVVQSDLRLVLDRLKVAVAGEATLGSTFQIDNVSGPDHTKLPIPTIIVLFLLPEALASMEDDLRFLITRLAPPFRIVCNTWPLPRTPVDEQFQIRERTGTLTNVFLYRSKQKS